MEKKSLTLTSDYGIITVTKDSTGIIFNLPSTFPSSQRGSRLKRIKKKYSKEISEFRKGIKKPIPKKKVKKEVKEFSNIFYFTNLRKEEIKKARLEIKALLDPNFKSETGLSINKREALAEKKANFILDKYGIDLLPKKATSNGLDNTGIEYKNYLTK